MFWLSEQKIKKRLRRETKNEVSTLVGDPISTFRLTDKYCFINIIRTNR